MKEITVFSEGDSLDLNCWSNVPYLFTKTLEKKGIKVNRVNIYSNKYVRKTIWKYIFAPLLQLLYRGNIYEYDQTRLNRFFINLKIKRAIRRYKQSDLNLFLSYAYLNTDSKIPNVLFCDWTSEYVLLYRLNRKPLAIEKTYLQIQRSNIERADMVISLFPDIAKAMTEMYNREICYFNLNVINNVYERELNEEIILNRKKDSHILLFVGRKNYISGANLLIQVFSELKERYPLLELHIIGLSASDFKQLPQSVFCYDYLDKAKQNEKILYYELFLKAKIFINPTTLWGGYSSTVEAMFFYNPVIVSAYSSFVDSFGDEINFGYYVKNGQQDSLKACIIQIMDDPNYTRLCQNSHEAVKNFTWERYVDCFLERVEVLKKS